MYHIVVRPGSHNADMIFFSTHVGGQQKSAAMHNARPVILYVNPLGPSLGANMGVVPFNKDRY
jgi:hypothetical protein